MEEDHNNDTFASTSRASLILNCSQGNPHRKGAAHSSIAGKEEWSTSEAVNKKSEDTSFDPVGDADDPVQSVLELRVRDANLGQDLSEVVASQASTGKLREQTTTDADEEAISVTFRADEILVATQRLVSLQLDGCLDFCELELDYFVVEIAIGMILGHNLDGFVRSVFRNKPGEARQRVYQKV